MNTKKWIALLLAVLFVVSLCACSKKDASDDSSSGEQAAETQTASQAGATTTPDATAASETQPAATTAPQSGLYDSTGTYTAFGMSYEAMEEGTIISVSDTFSSDLTLNDDGTGSIQISSVEGGQIESWTVSGDKLTLVIDGEKQSGTIKDGIIILPFEETGTSLYFAKPGADISGYQVLTADQLADILSGEQ